MLRGSKVAAKTLPAHLVGLLEASWGGALGQHRRYGEPLWEGLGLSWSLLAASWGIIRALGKHCETAVKHGEAAVQH